MLTFTMESIFHFIWSRDSATFFNESIQNWNIIIKQILTNQSWWSDRFEWLQPLQSAQKNLIKLRRRSINPIGKQNANWNP